MQAEVHSWESSLLSLAHEAHHAESPHAGVAVAPELLDAAYDCCNALTAAGSRSFHFASGLLPRAKRRAVRALYAFCRVTDDIVDRPSGGDPSERLEAWRRRLAQPDPPTDDLVALAWADARARFGVPWRLAEQLIDGVARDTVQTRYTTFDDLAAYSYGVASTVGLMSMHIVGFRGPEAIPYAIKLGVALQLTNILRDVADDYRNGRVYLPAEEMEDFGVTEEMIGAGRVGERWRAFMRSQIERNRRLYDEARPGIALLEADGRFAVAAAADIYRGILRDIEQHGFDNLSRRAHVTAAGKLRMLPGIWSRSRRPRASAS